MKFTNLLDTKNRCKLRKRLINNHDKEKKCLGLMIDTGKSVLPDLALKRFVIDRISKKP